MIDGITRPTLLLDLAKVNSNIEFMLEKAKLTNTMLVPHFKTHQSKEIGEIFREKGIDAAAVSSVEMAEYFVKHGWKDITVAFPFNRLEIQVINSFLTNGVKVKLLATDLDTITFLNQELVETLDIFIEIDAGYGRSGVHAKNTPLVKEMVTAIEQSDKMNLYGLYCHCGDTYHANDTREIEKIWENAMKELAQIKAQIEPTNRPLKIRMGDTPGCSMVQHMEPIDEIGPGNFVFYDLVMNYLNVCKEEDIAVAVACPVIAKYPERNEVLIHGGAVHFSKDHLFDATGQKFFGEMVVFEDNQWSSIIEGAKLTSISQEHGILTVTNELMQVLKIGDVIGILPIHSCLTANLMKSYQTTQGDEIAHMSLGVK
ncbi:alanine racemase [Roseivirga misakiensis]|uniref:D-serine dehydratase-like domain-containing protein n=1 Tax=Roseivirga misakiensis TaxID=1563681 RepID=A0A1E5T1U1_9BACT|nr:alanine racemase [Roseivirga misakiensis]OEK05267.1 hypothetical protein BFP71_17865 [Roseivirga misakiensis]